MPLIYIIKAKSDNGRIARFVKDEYKEKICAELLVLSI